MSETIITKRCSTCKNNKPISEFNKNRAQKDGYHNQCKICKCEDYKILNQTIRGRLKYIFKQMLQRCNNPKNKDYKYYGGRGIRVKFESLIDFRNYVMNVLEADPRGLTIDRKFN